MIQISCASMAAAYSWTMPYEGQSFRSTNHGVHESVWSSNGLQGLLQSRSKGHLGSFAIKRMVASQVEEEEVPTDISSSLNACFASSCNLQTKVWWHYSPDKQQSWSQMGLAALTAGTCLCSIHYGLFGFYQATICLLLVTVFWLDGPLQLVSPQSWRAELYSVWSSHHTRSMGQGRLLQLQNLQAGLTGVKVWKFLNNSNMCLLESSGKLRCTSPTCTLPGFASGLLAAAWPCDCFSSSGICHLDCFVTRL